MQTPPVTIGYFHNDYGRGCLSPSFLAALNDVYPDARVVNCAIPCPEQHMMAARTKSYSMLRQQVRGDLILLDTDVIARKPVEFDGEWSIGLTRTREETPLMRYNGGVILVRDTADAQQFLDQVQYHATVLPADFGEFVWYIDQLAITYVAKGNPCVREFGGEYNYIPKNRDERIESAYFVHYKGKRKAWISDLEVA